MIIIQKMLKAINSRKYNRNLYSCDNVVITSNYQVIFEKKFKFT